MFLWGMGKRFGDGNGVGGEWVWREMVCERETGLGWQVRVGAGLGEGDGLGRRLNLMRRGGEK